MGDVADAEQTTPPHVEVWRSVRVGGDTKTRRSRRTLALPSRCVDALRNQHDRQAAERASAGARWQDHGLVFPSSVGTPMSAGNARRSFRSALKLVPDLSPMEWTPRELRHSFFSVLSDPGVPLEEISRLVGHAGTTVTELVYRHQLKPVIQTGATVMDRLFGAETESVVTQLICRWFLSRGHGWAGRLTGCVATGPFLPGVFDLGQRVKVRRAVKADMRGLVTAGRAIRWGRFRWSR